MSNNHLAEPLDYLYEELPPEGMAEARRHLAVCPDCRARVREIRETVKRYRNVPRPAAPEGLAARTAAAALAAARSAVPAPETRLDGTEAAPRRNIRANAVREPAQPVSLAPVVIVAPSPETSEQRQARLEEDFARLKREVRDEVRGGRGRWFFHPAWTVAASALFVASLVIHFSPRARQFVQTIRVGGDAAPASAPAVSRAREIRNREPIPAVPQPRAAEAVPPGEPPPLLRQANAREALPLPAFAASGSAEWAAPAALPEAAPQSEAFANTFAGSAADNAAVNATDSGADSAADMAEETLETAAAGAASLPALAPAPAPVPASPPAADAAMLKTGSVSARAAAMERVQPPEQKPEAEVQTLEEPADAVFSFAAVPPEQEETTPLLTPDELAALVSVPADAEEDSGTVVAMADMSVPPQLIARPKGFDAAERVRTLTALAGMQIASGEFADARKTAEMLREYDAGAAEEIASLIVESEKAAAAEKEAGNGAESEPAETPEENARAETIPAGPEPGPEPEAPITEASEPEPEPEVPIIAASAPESGEASGAATSKYDSVLLSPVAPEELPPFDPVPAPAAPPLLSPHAFPGAMVEPPEDPPLSVVRVPAYMRPAASIEIVADAGAPVISEPVPPPSGEFRDAFDPSRTAELARMLASVGTSESTAVPATSPSVSAPIPVQPLESMQVIPLHVYIQPDPAPAKPPRERFTTDPYLRDD